MEEARLIKEVKLNHPIRLGTANPAYTVEKLLRETASVNRFNPPRCSSPYFSPPHSPRTKGLPSIVARMQSNRR
jgi:hypothetical protein